MITNWEQFFGVVSKMRECQKRYFDTHDPIMLGEAKKYEKLVDECIAEREQRKTNAKGETA